MKVLMRKDERFLSNIYTSIILGSLFIVAILGYTAIAAKDGRMPVTDWLDPMLAGLTLVCIIIIQVLLVLVWNRIQFTKVKIIIGSVMILSQWFYIFGEILSNTITIGEPPRDIGSLFEIAGGSLAFLSVFGLSIVFIQSIYKVSTKSLIHSIVLLSFFLLAGLVWWFSHPIDQSNPGTPQCVQDNSIYNLFHGPCKG